MCGNGDCRPLHTIRFEPLPNRCRKCGDEAPLCRCFLQDIARLHELHTPPAAVNGAGPRVFVAPDGTLVVDQEVSL